MVSSSKNVLFAIIYSSSLYSELIFSYMELENTLNNITLHNGKVTLKCVIAEVHVMKRKCVSG